MKKLNTTEARLASQSERPKIVVAIPAYNVGRYVDGVVKRARQFTDEVIVVDDGSSDGTALIARAAGADIVNHTINRGYGGSLKSCFEYARLNNADALVIIDGDGQHDPDDIPKLLGPVLSGQADLVVGSRFVENLSEIPGYRKFGIRVITFLFNFGSRIKTTDAQSGFRVYNQRVIGAVNIHEKGMSASIEILEQARAKRATLKDIPISCSYDSSSISLKAIRHGLSVAFSVVKIRLLNRLFYRS